MTQLIYIMDPLCGWCYGNSHNITALFESHKTKFNFKIIPAGMWAGTNTRMQSPQMAAYFRKHDQQISRLTGTVFGKAYFSFIEQHPVQLDSEIPSRAIITVQELWPQQNVNFMVAVQQARYLHGKDLNLQDTYEVICSGLNINPEAFTNAFNTREMHLKTLASFNQALQYASSYPTLLLEKEEKLYLIEQGYASLKDIEEKITSLIGH